MTPPKKKEKDAARSRFADKYEDCLACVAEALAEWECERRLNRSGAADARVRLRKHQSKVHGRVTVPLPMPA